MADLAQQDAIDPRIVRVSVEINGKFQVYEDLEITARARKTANPLQDTCEVTIGNLSRQTRNLILTETSPFNKDRKPKRLLVEAGRKSVGVSQIFYGEITSASPTQPPDIKLVLKAQTGAFAKGNVIARSGAAVHSLQSLSASVAQDLGCSLNFQADDKQIANYAFTGGALRQVDQLGATGDVDAYVDGQTLVVKRRGEPLANRTKIVSLESGMIGIPEITEHGIKVRYLLDTDTVLGGALEVTSLLNPAVNGTYSIYALEFDVASRATPFYFIADARRTVYYKAPKIKRAPRG